MPEPIKADHPTYLELRALVDDTLTRKILELHAPVVIVGSYGTIMWACKGCDPGEYAEGPADAPCATFRLIADAHGIEVAS